MKKIFKITVVSLSFLILITACKKDWLDVNTDPNFPAEANKALVFPAAIGSAVTSIGSSYALLGGMWSQYWTQSNVANQYKYIDEFNITSTSFDRFPFRELYSGCLNDLKYVRETATADEDWIFVLMTTVTEAYVYQILADLYGQIPFDEALQGDIGLYAPHYQPAEEVYDSLFVRIDRALALDFTATTNSPAIGGNDFLFGGDVDGWKAFANTLKLKMYLRYVNTDAAFAQSKITALISSGVSFLDEDAAMTQFIEEVGKQNPLYDADRENLNVATNLRASHTMLSFLQDNSDPREVDFYRVPVNGGARLGLIQGNFNAASTEVDGNTISVAEIYFDDPTYFISKSESYFLQAEAAMRYGLSIGGMNAKALYEAGVTEAMTARYEHSATALLAGAYAYPAGTTAENLEAIMTQKWVSNAPLHGLESWFDRNRTGYPVTSTVPATDPTYVGGEFTYPIGGTTSGVWPKRLIFPDSEVTRNPNTPARVALNVPVWWAL